MQPVTLEETTLRDGEQAPGVNFLPSEKREIASLLGQILTEHDTIDCGFPATSRHEMETVADISRIVKGPYLLGVSRLRQSDIDATSEALCGYDRRTIALIVPSSQLHREIKLGLSEQELLDTAIQAVSYARRFFPLVAVAFEDATRSEMESLVQLTDRLIESGARVFTYADTCGVADPWSYGDLFRTIVSRVANIDKVHELGAHCHDDLGLATANSLAAVRAGARRVGCAFNGLGERAGNTPTEEFLIAMNQTPTLGEISLPPYRYEMIAGCSETVARLSGVSVPPNKAVVGRNCFRHESGIHQDGMLKDARMYQPYPAHLIGREGPEFTLGKNSSRHVLARRLVALGISLEQIDGEATLTEFRTLAHHRKEVTDADLEGLAARNRVTEPATPQ